MVGGACRLCTTEKLFIIEHPNESRLLNSHCIEKCRHGEKYMLSSVKRTRVRNANIDMDQRFLGGGENVIDA